MPLSMAISLSQLDQDVVDPPGDDAVVNGDLSLPQHMLSTGISFSIF